MAGLRITTDKVAAPKFAKNLAGLHDRFHKAFTAALNMAASMIKEQGDKDIRAGGKFGSSWTDAYKVEASPVLGNMRINMSLDKPGAGIFETGGTIKGKPLLWIPLSGTDAAGIPASAYPSGLFSVQRKSGRPLLFSLTDKQPKYFGIESVTIPKKFHLAEIQRSVMANFRSIFDTAFRAAD